MPTYEYECAACRHRFEKFQSMTAAPVKTCPKCGKRKVERLIGAGAGIIFKGSGFYETDYKRKAAPTGESGDSGKADKPAAEKSGGGGSADAKKTPAKKDKATKADK